ncbi:hypothetical protein Tco_0495753 [Tanacetum coccineum]
MNQEYFYSHSSGFDQFQPPQFSDVYQIPPVASMEMLHAQADLIESMQSFLMKYDHIPHNEKSIKLLLAEEKFLKIKQVVEEEQFQPEYLQALLQSLLKDLQILNEIQPLKQETPTPFLNDQKRGYCGICLLLRKGILSLMILPLDDSMILSEVENVVSVEEEDTFKVTMTRTFLPFVHPIPGFTGFPGLWEASWLLLWKDKQFPPFPSLKGLQRQKEAKTIKNRQETGKRQKDKSKSEESAKDHSRISPTQQEMKSKVNLMKSKIQGFIWKFEDSRTKFAKEEKLLLKEKERKKTTRADHAILKLHFTLEWAEETTGTNCAITPNIQTEPA